MKKTKNVKNGVFDVWNNGEGLVIQHSSKILHYEKYKKIPICGPHLKNFFLILKLVKESTGISGSENVIIYLIYWSA